MVVQVARRRHTGYGCGTKSQATQQSTQAHAWTRISDAANHSPVRAFTIEVYVSFTTGLLCFSLTPSSVDSDAFHNPWQVCTSTWTLENLLLHSGPSTFKVARPSTVKVALVLDLETEAALSLHEALDPLCRKLK